ncbi:hypothetical protein HCUR_01167 [Holospora curviuscula]|uniref:Uncharacterized protein n=1 Tax=Holospora curviuscula TaxID=1082868 RepID=A0A2S5R7V1_9PROT|nr:hypothetical protein HCUR_01167 [Holospora curviuscula]
MLIKVIWIWGDFQREKIKQKKEKARREKRSAYFKRICSIAGLVNNQSIEPITNLAIGIFLMVG